MEEEVLYFKYTYLLTFLDKSIVVIRELWQCEKERNGNIQRVRQIDETNLGNYLSKNLISSYGYDLMVYENEALSTLSITYFDNNGNTIVLKKEREEKFEDLANLVLENTIIDFIIYEQDQNFRLTSIEYNIYGTIINIPARILCPRDNTFFNYQQAVQLAVDNNLQYSIPELTNNIISRILSGNDYSVEASFVYAMIFSGILENINKNGSINPNLRFLFYKSHNELYRDKDILPLLRRLQYNNNNGAEVVFQNNDQQNNDNNNNILILAPNFEKLGHTSIYFKKIHNNDQQIFLFDTQSSEIRNIENITTYYNNNFIYNIQTTYGGGSCTMLIGMLCNNIIKYSYNSDILNNNLFFKISLINFIKQSIKLIDDEKPIIYKNPNINKIDTYAKIQIEDSNFYIKKDWKNINSIRLEGFIHMLRYFGFLDDNTLGILLQNTHIIASINDQNAKGLNVQEQDNAGRHGNLIIRSNQEILILNLLRSYDKVLDDFKQKILSIINQNINLLNVNKSSDENYQLVIQQIPITAIYNLFLTLKYLSNELKHLILLITRRIYNIINTPHHNNYNNEPDNNDGPDDNNSKILYKKNFDSNDPRNFTINYSADIENGNRQNNNDCEKYKDLNDCEQYIKLEEFKKCKECKKIEIDRVNQNEVAVNRLMEDSTKQQNDQNNISNDINQTSKQNYNTNNINSINQALKTENIYLNL